MYSFEKQRIISGKDPDRLNVRVNRRKEALQKLADYLRKERGYSEKKIKKLISESFVEKVDCIEKANCSNNDDCNEISFQ